MILNSDNILLIGSILLFASVIVSRASHRFGVPVLLLFLIVGMFFGVDGVGIMFDNALTAQFIGKIALGIILFSGGMDTNIREIKPILGKGLAMSTIGVFLTTIITGYFIFYVTGLITGFVTLTLAESMLLAAVMSSTDSASVFSLLRSKSIKLKGKLKPLLEFESGSNDPMAYMLTVLIIQIINSGDWSAWETALMFVLQMSIGSALGYFLGRGALWVMSWINVENRSLYSVLLLAFVFFIFSFTEHIKGNGYLAVYIAGLIIGNGKMVHKESLKTFFDGFAWLFQIVMFLTLGLLINPNELWSVFDIGLLIAFFLIIVARPIATFLCLAPFKGMTTNSKLFISWVGLRGAVPIIFATYPLTANIGNAKFMFNIVFFVTIISLLVQGTTIGYAANLLGLSDTSEKKE